MVQKGIPLRAIDFPRMMERYWMIAQRSWICRLRWSQTWPDQLLVAPQMVQAWDFAPQTAKLKNSLAPPHLAWRPIVAQELAPQAVASNPIVVQVL
jgi:hypothetical protein